ncbi:NmrA/HSCARG family protein [Hamadaea tsunoensis]|uniref:NmrA/HSCARG family protein n=1 Tax=Hamadaea tsunoensis TaxID=53368 RepID=UPI0004158941|nr:NmrA/HSCARG family protein [Hamadaea tsunoensis]
MKTFAITGATGTQGGTLAHLLLDRGHPVRALTRSVDAPAAQALKARGAEIAYADFADPASLTTAFQGVDSVFLMTTPFGTDVETEIRHGSATIDAAARAGVGHIVFSSVAHADRATGVPHFDSKYAVERHLVASGLDWTILGPAKFMDNFTTGYAARMLAAGDFALPLAADRSIALICAADIAGLAALALTEPERLSGKRIDIAGEETTPLRMAEAFTAAVGHEVTFQATPAEQSRAWGEDLYKMFRYFDTVGLDVDVTALRREYPEVGWHTFADWLATRTW